MKKILLALPMSLLLFACNSDDDYLVENNLIESVNPSLESTDKEGKGREDQIIHCGNRWDCTKKQGNDKTITPSQATTQILNVK